MKRKYPIKIKLFPGSKHPKSLKIYKEVNGKMNKWSTILHLLITIATPICLVVPLLMYSLFNYYNADDCDNDDDTFITIIPLWYLSYIYLCSHHGTLINVISIPFDFHAKSVGYHLMGKL